MAGSYAAMFDKTARIPGVIAVGPEGIKWAPNTPGAAKALKMKYSDVSLLRVSKAATSKKAMMMLSMSTPSKVQYIFEFNNFDEREQCRCYVAKFVTNNGPAEAPTAGNKRAAPPGNLPPPPSKKQAVASDNQASTSACQAPRARSSEEIVSIERRMKMLNDDPNLRRLHSELVSRGALTEAEFWADRKLAEAKMQNTGWRSEMIAEMRGNIDGRANKVSYQLTPEIIHQIFLEKPAVHKAFLDFVPAKMTDEEFWKKYFRAEVLHKKNDANSRAEADADEDLAVFFKDDPDIAEHNLRRLKRVDPTVDMVSDFADYVAIPGHGIYRDGTKEPEAGSSKSRLASMLNRHAEVVLAGRQNLDAESKDTMSVARFLLHREQSSVTDSPTAEEREARVSSMTELEDLRGPQGPSLVPLSIEDPRKYFDVQNSRMGDASSSSMEDPEAAMQNFWQQIRSCRSPNFQIPSNLAEKVFSDLTHSITTAKHPLGRTTEKNVLDDLPRQIGDQLRGYSSTVHELLRHFWATYPITSAGLEAKATRYKDQMHRLYKEIQDMKNSTQSEHRHHVSLILQPITKTLDEAISHYEIEASRRNTKHQQ